jgi:hypothetical protein
MGHGGSFWSEEDNGGAGAKPPANKSFLTTLPTNGHRNELVNRNTVPLTPSDIDILPGQ